MFCDAPYHRVIHAGVGGEGMNIFLSVGIAFLVLMAVLGGIMYVAFNAWYTQPLLK